MKRRLLILSLCLLAIQVAGADLAAAEAREPVKVAFVHDRAVAGWADAIRDSLRAEVRRVLDVDYEVRVTDEFVGDGSRESVRAGLVNALRTDVDLVIASGPLGTFEASRLPERAHPVIGAWVLDPEIQQVSLVDGASGVPNFTYVSSGNVVLADLAALDRVLGYEHLVAVGSGIFLDAFPEGTVVPTEAGGHRISTVHCDGTVEGTLAAIPADADVVYLLPLVELEHDHVQGILDGLLARRLPVLSMRGEVEVRDGALLGTAPDDWTRRVNRRVALTASLILGGEDASRLPVAMTRESRLFLNARTAERIGVSPPFELLTEAVVFGEMMPPGTVRLDLSGAIASAQMNNRQIAATRAAVAAGAAQVDVAKAELLPQVDMGLGGYLIDDDTAAFFPTESERMLTGTASLTQIIWSDRAWAGYSIEKHLQEARVGELNRVSLDVGLEAASAYVDVLRAKTRLQIQRQNLAFSRANLERAEVRVSVGDANRSELYRWQSKIAGEQTRVMDAGVTLRLGFLELNRVLNRDLEEPIELVDATIDDQFQIVVDERVDRFIKDPASLEILRDFLTQKGLAGSPELQQFDASILAAERAHTAANRSFWSPDVGLTGAVDHVFSRGGEGSEITDPQVPDDTSWNVGVFLSLPLFEGGARFAETNRTTQETYRLMRDREATAQRIEQDVRASTYQVAASRLAIDLARRASIAAMLNLELVADNYTLGRVSLVDLLDAQTNALNTELAAAEAVNDYLLDLMRVERSVGQFMFFVSAEDREAWIYELERYAAARP